MIFYAQLGAPKYRGWWVAIGPNLFSGPYSSTYAARCASRRMGLL